MSPLKLNSLLIGIVLAIFVAVGSSTMAQDGLRLWKPYSPESFGGGRRGHDGVYGSLSGIYWTISTPKDGYIGATTVKGKDDTRRVFDSISEYTQTNSLRINMMSPTTTLGTRFEVGNRLRHHGWLVSGYGLPGQSHSMSAQNVSVVIRDEGNTSYLNEANLAATLYVWDRQHNTMLDPRALPNNTPFADWGFAGWQYVDRANTMFVTGLGYLWGYFAYEGGPGVVDADGELVSGGVGLFAPLPIRFDNVSVHVASSHYSAELMYTYRPHPFTWGSMELLAGARYWEFKDTFGFQGTSFAGTDDDATTVVTNPQLPRTGLTSMIVNAEGMNRVFGPQIGMKLSRHNARWTFGAEGRLTAGINAQSVKTEGSLRPRSADTQFSGAGPDLGMWGPIGLQNNNNNFGHKQNKTYFSPIGELRLCADWQWTSAVSFFGALDGMFASNIARGVRVTDYVVKSDGTIFGIRDNDRNTDVFVYGVEAGIKVKR